MTGPEQALARLGVRPAGLPAASLQLQENGHILQCFPHSCSHPQHSIRSELLGAVLL